MRPRSIHSRPISRAGSVLLALLLPSLAAAQQGPPDRAIREPVTLPSGAVVYPQGVDPDRFLSPKSGFGTDDLHVVNVPFSGFFPRFSSATYTTLCCITEGARWPTANDNYAARDDRRRPCYPTGPISNRSRSTSRTIPPRPARISGAFSAAAGSTPTAPTRTKTVRSRLSPTSNPGNTVITFDPNFPVRYRHDIDERRDRRGRQLHARGPSSGQILRRSTTVRSGFARPACSSAGRFPPRRPWRRFPTCRRAIPSSSSSRRSRTLASPPGAAPASTVPTAPLTRGQMAVFLAKALGLHWPAF